MATRDGSKEGQPQRDLATERFASKAHEALDTVANGAEHVERELRGAATRTAEHAREIQQQATARAEQGIQRVASYVESNPLTFAGIAFAAGVLFSTMLLRR